MNTNQRIGNVIRSLRMREGLTQEQLADVLKLSRSSIGMYETGERKLTPELLELFADHFNVDMNYITGSIKEDAVEYYVDLKSKQIAQEILNNKELRALFDASRNATPEDLEITKNLLLSLKNKEKRSVDG